MSIEPYMEDLDDNQFQHKQPNEITNNIVVKIGTVNRENHDSDDIEHKWTIVNGLKNRNAN